MKKIRKLRQASSASLTDQEVRDPRFAELDRQIAEEQERRKKLANRSTPRPLKKRRSDPLPKEYRLEITRMAGEHNRKFKRLLLGDPKLKERAARFYRSLLLPKPKRSGRPAIESVTRAEKLLKRYKREFSDEKPEQWWKRIYPQVIPSYEEMDREEQKAKRLLLRERVKSRRNQRQRRKKPLKANA